MKIREAEGGGYESRGKFYVRVTIAPQNRPGKLAPWATSLPQAIERAQIVQAMVQRLRAAGEDDVDFLENLLERLAVADAEKLAAIGRQVDALLVGKGERIAPVVKGATGPTTFGKFAGKWSGGELARDYPDHVGKKKSSRDDGYRLDILGDVIGDVPLASFTLDHADEAMRRLDEIRRKRAGRDVKPLDVGGRRQYAQLIARTLKLAAYPARVIPASPLPAGWLPKGTANKAKGLLYPDEERDTLQCRAHAVHWRVFFGFLARSGFRVDEAAGLTMSDVDVERGIITLDSNKTDDPRAPRYGAEVMIALKLWRDWYRADAKPDAFFFTRPDGSRIPVDGLADFYREHFVRDAGVDRAELFTRSKNRIPLRVHDLRGFFVTYALAGGASETYVMDCTGHKSSTMVNRYRRVARTVAEAALGAPTALHLAVPELAAAFTAANAAAATKRKLPKSRSTASNRSASGPIAQSVELRTFNRDVVSDDGDQPQDSAGKTTGLDEAEATPMALPPRSAAASEPTDAELERGILDALTKGLDGVAKALSGRLDERRRERAGNVVNLDSRRPRR